jgi:hypothetical protein
MEHRGDLTPEKRWGDQLAAAIQVGTCAFADPVERKLDHEARVDDQHS